MPPSTRDPVLASRGGSRSVETAPAGSALSWPWHGARLGRCPAGKPCATLLCPPPPPNTPSPRHLPDNCPPRGAHSSPPPPPPCLEGLCDATAVPKNLGFDPNRTASEFEAAEGTASPACCGDRDAALWHWCVVPPQGETEAGGGGGMTGAGRVGRAWHEEPAWGRQAPEERSLCVGWAGGAGGALGPAPGLSAPAPCRAGNASRNAGPQF